MSNQRVDMTTASKQIRVDNARQQTKSAIQQLLGLAEQTNHRDLYAYLIVSSPDQPRSGLQSPGRGQHIGRGAR